MKSHDKLNDIFNVEPVPPSDTVLPAVLTSTNPEIAKEDDFDLARNTLRDLIVKNDAVMSDLVSLARMSEHPRAYEVAGQLIKTQSEIAKDLMNLHKLKKDVEKETPASKATLNQTNNILFNGSTAELMKLIGSGGKV